MTTRTRLVLIIAAILLCAGAALAYEIVSTRPVREAVRVYTELVSAGNRTDLSDEQRLTAARRLCSARYLAAGSLALGPEGGIGGLPRTINKNFQAWRNGPDVWICPTNRIGPVYQFIIEDGHWRFDGLIAILRARGEIIRTSEIADPDAP
ncbi:MAG: hypothetical protein ACLQU5_24935 [Isosphaeraceae bacterium]